MVKNICLWVQLKLEVYLFKSNRQKFDKGSSQLMVAIIFLCTAGAYVGSYQTSMYGIRFISMENLGF